MADQDYSTSGMVALIPSAEHLAALAVADGDPPEQLHLTLAFLGDDVDTWAEGVADAVRERMGALAADLTAGVEGAAFAHAVFNPDDAERDPCAVYLVNGDFSLRDSVLAELSATLEDAFPEQFPTFIPHVTAGYGLPVESLSYTGPVRFDRLRVAIGNDHTDYPLETNMPNGGQGNGIPVSLVVVVEGLETRDGRFIEPGALTHAALPLPILAQTRNPDGGSGHDGAEIIGRMDTLRRIPGPELTSRQTGQPFPEGTFVWVAEGEIGSEYDATGLVQRGYLTGNSVDLVDVTVEMVWPDEPDDTDDDVLIFLEPEQVRLTSGQIAATTLVPIGAFGEACITLAGQIIAPADDLDRALVAAAWRSADIGDESCVPCAAADDSRFPAITAAGENDLPPVDAFADPGLDEPTALRRDGDRVFGHLALWGTCHIGVVGQCLTPPRSATGYAYFRTGAVMAWNGTDAVETPTGVLTVGTGHANDRLGPRATAEHYDNTGTAVADVAAGEDAHGIWVAGVLRPSASEEQVAALIAAPLSGDWRRIGGNLELVAALAVNVPGFPVPRVRVASGAPQSLVAAGVLPPEPQASRDDADDLADRVAARLAEVYGLVPVAEARAALGFGPDLQARRRAALARLAQADLSARHRAVVARLQSLVDA